MRLIRFGAPGAEKPGLIDQDGTFRDVSAFGPDFDSLFLGGTGLQDLQDWFAKNKANCPEVPATERLGPPVCGVSKIVCVGLNYAKHAAESGMDVPTEPVLFFKATSAICGPNDPVIIPKNSEKTDWEVELAVVIGKEAHYVSEAEAMNHVAGYMVHNDYSERAFQLEQGGQWVKGKSCDTFAPLGPALVTRDEIPDPHNLRLWLKVNDEMMQDSNTSDLVFQIPYLIHYISQYMRLQPGDIISTGTPFGVGLGLTPPRYLKAGDVVVLGIAGVGECQQKAVAYSKS